MSDERERGQIDEPQEAEEQEDDLELQDERADQVKGGAFIKIDDGQ